MTTVTVAKKEYDNLLDKALRYEYLKQAMSGDIFSTPPIKSAKVAISALKKTKLYSSAFIASLAKGLDRSSYFKK